MRSIAHMDSKSMSYLAKALMLLSAQLYWLQGKTLNFKKVGFALTGPLADPSYFCKKKFYFFSIPTIPSVLRLLSLKLSMKRKNTFGLLIADRVIIVVMAGFYQRSKPGAFTVPATDSLYKDLTEQQMRQ